VSTWKVILATIVIYCAGLVTGGLVVRSARTPKASEVSPAPFQGPEFVQQRFLERMKRELALAPDQAQRLEAIFRDSRERMRSWWEIIGPDMRAELKEVQEKIKAELTPAQREKFEQLLKDRRHSPGALQGDRRPRDRRPPGAHTAPRPAGDDPSGGAPPPPPVAPSNH
jgi:Spy/CpxP family protein refolding chaperone